MSKRDYYDVLGTNKSASDADIKRAYRKSAMKYHPDKNQGDKVAEKKFKEVNEAYEVLKDSNKRSSYDQHGHNAFQGGNSSNAGFNGGAGFSDIFGDIFGDFMGGSQGGQKEQQRGANLRYDMRISLEEAFSGIKKMINIKSAVSCDSCRGSGADSSSEVIHCSRCNGSGTQRTQQGFFTMERTCASCQGTGQIIKNPCKSCYGQGRMQKARELKITIPAGVENGTKIRLSGEGEAGLNSAPAGDLYVFITVKAHNLFDRSESDIYFSTTIPMTLAILGGEIAVPTIDGSETNVKIPAGTQSNKKLRLRSKGMSILRQSIRGDMYISVVVETPVNLNNKQMDLINNFHAIAEKQDNSPNSSSFSKKIKEFLNSF